MSFYFCTGIQYIVHRCPWKQIERDESWSWKIKVSDKDERCNVSFFLTCSISFSKCGLYASSPKTKFSHLFDFENEIEKVRKKDTLIRCTSDCTKRVTRSFPLSTIFHFPRNGISQLSTSKYRAVVQQSKSYNSLCTQFKRAGVLWIASHDFLAVRDDDRSRRKRECVVVQSAGQPGV